MIFPASATSWPGAAARLERARLPMRALIGFLAGVVMAFGQPPVGFWPAMFLAGPVVLWLWSAATSPREAFLTGLAVGGGYFGFALHWIVEPFLVDAATHAWMIPFAILLLCGGMGLFWGAGFALARTAALRLGVANAFAGAALLAAGVSLGEFTRSYILTGFPWALPAYSWIDTPAAQTAALFGPYALSLITLFLVLLPGAGLGAGPARAAGVVAPVALVAAGWFWGSDRLSAAPSAEGPLIRIVQTDVDQLTKWDPENVRPNFERLLAQSTLSAEEPPAVVVWPESAVTFAIDMSPEARSSIADALAPTEVALGSLRLDGGPGGVVDESSRWRNSLFLVREDGTLSKPFDKNHLVPFGEYMPLDGVLRRNGLGDLGGLAGGIIPGEETVVMTPANAPPFAPLICYEMIFPRETAAAAEGAAWLVLATNDAWFGGWAGPVQHLAKARMRAIETGLPIARSANAGISAMIDPYGRALGAVGPSRWATIDRRLPDSLPPPLYRRFGETGTTLALLALLVFSTIGRRGGAHRREKRRQ